MTRSESAASNERPTPAAGAVVAAHPAALRRGAVMPADERQADVLIVEDNAITQLITLERLRALGCAPATAASGTAALEIVTFKPFDLILLDCRLPDLDGFATARAIRAIERRSARKRAAIVAITGVDDVDCVERCLAAGMDGHIAKPAAVEDLRLVFERYLI